MNKKKPTTKNSVEKVFEELKSKGIIKKNIKIKPGFGVLNFQASIIGKSIIKYNEELSNLDKDVLKFAILHEVGHLERKIWRELIGTIISFLVALLLTLSFSEFLRLNTFFYLHLVFLVIIFFYTFSLSFRLLAPWMKKSEFDADAWAIEQLVKFYNLKNPAKYVERVFKKYRKYLQRINEKHKSFIWQVLKALITFFTTILDYHPSDQERIFNIKTFFEED